MAGLRPWLAVVLVGMTALVSAGARAQECTEGREVGPQTQGRCCWPGQTYSEQLDRCSGPPRCPEGLAAEGDACVPAARAWAPPAPETQLASPVAPVPEPEPLAWPLVSSDIGVGVVNPRLLRTGSDTGYIVAGVTVLATGYVAGILVGVFDQLNSFSCSFGTCNSWPLGLIPVAGGVLAGTVSFSGFRFASGWGFGLGIPAAVVQSLGITLLLVGLFLDREELVPSMEAGSATIRVTPHASADAGGLSITVEL